MAPIRRDGTTVHPVDPEASPQPPAAQKKTKKWVPWLVPAIVVVNTLMFIITMYVNDCPEFSDDCVARFLGRFSFQPLKENPLFGPSSYTGGGGRARSRPNIGPTLQAEVCTYCDSMHPKLTKVGAQVRDKVIHGHQGWRLVTCMWLHAGVLHLLANMLSLVVIGIRLLNLSNENFFGLETLSWDGAVLVFLASVFNIGLLYFISGFGGNVLSALFLEPNTVSVGASGALFGLLGGMLSELIMNWSIYACKVAALLTLVTIIIVNLAVGLVPHVDNFAHIGGFLSGFLLGFIFLIQPQFGWTSQRHAPPGRLPTSSLPKFKVYQYVLWVLSLVLLIVGFAFGITLALHGFDANKHCSWCRYLSCFPTKHWSCNGHSGTCQAVQTGDQITMTCSNDGTRTYTLSNATEIQLQRLCNQLCN